MKWVLACLLSFSAVTTSAAVETQSLQRGSFQKIIAAHAGKPFIVALWSLSCTHCAADLEIFQRLAKKHAEFDLVLISTDTPAEEVVLASTLARYQLGRLAVDRRGRVESWVFADSYVERLRYEIDASWYGELPRTYFFDSLGKAKGVSGVLDEARLENWLKISGN